MSARKINFPKLARMVGGLMLIEALFMLIPLFTGIWYGEADWRTFALAAGCTAMAGYGLMNVPVSSSHLGKREGFLLTASVWVVFSLFGMIPFIFGSPRLDFTSAFFESISAFTTTGATTILPDEIHLSRCIVIWQALMQWLGGMGIILFTLAIIPAFNTSGGMQMFNAEVTGVTHDKLRPRISQTAMALWGIYFVLTLVLIVLLWAGPLDLFDSICYGFGTLSTGGFSPDPANTALSSNYVMGAICIFMVLGGINFAMIYRLLLGRWKHIRADEVMRLYMWSIVVMSVLFAIARITSGSEYNLREIVLEPVFQVVSCITSTGYLAPDFTLWQPFVLSLMIIMMFTGGCAGSTSGGSKIDRALYLGKFVANEVRHGVHPNAVYSVKINKTIVNPDLVSKVVAFLCIYVLLIVSGGTLLSFMGLSPVDSFFSAFSCMSNTGFGASVTGYGNDFHIIPGGAKWVLSFLMLTGRLEIYTVMVLFSRSFWR